MNEYEIEMMAQDMARLHTMETIETAIKAILGDCKGALDVLAAMEKPSYLSLKRAAQIKREAVNA